MAKLDELKSLSPQERIKKLKELEEERKKEIEEAEKLIKESNVEIEEERKELERIPIPQLKTVDIQGLFTAEEREIFSVKRFVEKKAGSLEDELKGKEAERLEETVREEAERKEKEGLDREKLNQSYHVVKDLFEKAREDHYLNKEQREMLYQGVRDINEAARHYAENREVAHIRDTVRGEAEGLRKYMGLRD
ncbi:hypothetical protein HYU07_07335 [Candidatus Woesearchaeota archaeon]|nr:hypothetical protein [Candidatus Woesearchaeota archaeon]